MKQAMDSTAKLSAFVLFILIGARVFSLTFYGVDGHKWVEELLVGLPGGEIGFLIVVNCWCSCSPSSSTSSSSPSSSCRCWGRRRSGWAST